MNTKCIGIAFYKGTKKDNPDSSFLDRVICRITRSPYSHVEVVVQRVGEKYLCFSSSHRERGVRFKLIDLNSGHWKLLKAKDQPNLSTVYGMFDMYQGTRYDYLGLLSTVLPFTNANIKNRLFCSELVANLLEYEKPYRYSPGKLYNKLKKE